jgi:inositol transport system substrate-binding protein
MGTREVSSMHNRRRAALLGAAAIVGLALLGPGRAGAQDITIMTSVPSLGFPFFVHMMKELKDEAQKLGVRTIESDGQNSAPKQTADLEAAIVQGVSGIVISPLDVNAMAPAIMTAIETACPSSPSTAGLPGSRASSPMWVPTMSKAARPRAAG